MKIKLAILASLAFGLFAVVGQSSAMAESTQLCTVDEEPCTKPVKHMHLVGESALLTSVINVECSTLFLGDTSGSLESHQPLEGTFTFTSCGSCTVTSKEEKPGDIEREGTEVGLWHQHIAISFACTTLNCTYTLWAWGDFAGPLGGGGTNGKLTFEEKLTEHSGLLCPKSATLELELEPLSPIYMKS